ncbi:MAG: HIT family protein [Pacificimonas sp.]
MNDTMRTFGYPDTLICEYDHWVVLLRPAQPTLGSLVLAAKSDVTAFADLPAAAFAELSKVSNDIDSALKASVKFEKLNYLMLMMVDPHVHYHVIPRYEGIRSHAGTEYSDAGWPKVPALGEAVKLTNDMIATLVADLKTVWA